MTQQQVLEYVKTLKENEKVDLINLLSTELKDLLLFQVWTKDNILNELLYYVGCIGEEYNGVIMTNELLTWLEEMVNNGTDDDKKIIWDLLHDNSCDMMIYNLGGFDSDRDNIFEYIEFDVNNFVYELNVRMITEVREEKINSILYEGAN